MTNEKTGKFTASQQSIAKNVSEDVTYKIWKDYKWQLKNSIRDIATFEKLTGIRFTWRKPSKSFRWKLRLIMLLWLTKKTTRMTLFLSSHSLILLSWGFLGVTWLIRCMKTRIVQWKASLIVILTECCFWLATDVPCTVGIVRGSGRWVIQIIFLLGNR